MDKAKVLSTYRLIFKLIRKIPTESKLDSEKQLQVLRTTFRKHANLTHDWEIQSCMTQAYEHIAFLRMITPKKHDSWSSQLEEDDTTTHHPTNSTNKKKKGRSGVRKWIFTKDGKVEITQEDSTATQFQSGGRVVSNWDGNNLDPCAVHRHKGQLNRMGFVNNLHAKGLF